MSAASQKILKTLENDDHINYKDADLKKYISNYSSELI